MQSVPQDFRCDRVRVAVNNDGKVVEVPPHPWMVSFVHGQLECISKINEQVVLFNKACMDKLVIQKSSQWSDMIFYLSKYTYMISNE